MELKETKQDAQFIEPELKVVTFDGTPILAHSERCCAWGCAGYE